MLPLSLLLSWLCFQTFSGPRCLHPLSFILEQVGLFLLHFRAATGFPYYVFLMIFPQHPASNFSLTKSLASQRRMTRYKLLFEGLSRISNREPGAAASSFLGTALHPDGPGFLPMAQGQSTEQPPPHTLKAQETD